MDKFVFDIETSPIEDWLDPRPDKFLCGVGGWLNEDDSLGELKVYTDPNELIAELNRADTIIGHNIIAFDIPALEALGDALVRPATFAWDTLVASRMEHSGRLSVDPSITAPHSLEAWGAKLGFPKGNHKDFTQTTTDLIEYCKRDVTLTHMVYNIIYNNIYNIYNIPNALECELRIASIIAKQARDGIYFNTSLAHNLVTSITNTISNIDSELLSNSPSKYTLGTTYAKPFKIDGKLTVRVLNYCNTANLDSSFISGPFSSVVVKSVDWGSTKQVVTYFMEQGWKPTQYTDKGSPQLDGVDEFSPLGKLVLERQKEKHKLSTVEGLIKHVRSDRTISAGANSCGTNTHRMRHSRVVNIPKASTYPKGHEKSGQLLWHTDSTVQQSPRYGTEMRALFCARPGRVLFGYDASALELRILAHYINDENYTRIICDEDPHVFAQTAAGLHTRHDGKTLNYALIYGASDKRLGGLKGGGAREGADIRKRLYAAIPGLQVLDARVKRAASKGYLVGLDGRHLYIRPDKSPLNTLIQGGGATVMKYVTIEMDNLIKLAELDNPIKVLDMHDEAQYDVSPYDVDTLAKYNQIAFANVSKLLKLNCPVIGESKIGMNWAETH